MNNLCINNFFQITQYSLNFYENFTFLRKCLQNFSTNYVLLFKSICHLHPRQHFCKCDAIWETIHKVGKHDFEVFMLLHGEEIVSKSSILHRGMVFQRWNLQKGSFEKKVFKVFRSWRVENNFCRLL